ncbi:MAG: YiiG family protein [Lachnospiraceae bacterium]|nr:YiiG family protein [Lachnospiraceae bacterium]
MRRKCAIVLTALIMACSMTACQGMSSSNGWSVSNNKEPEVSSVAVEEETETVSSLSEEEAEELEQELYNTYINVNNFMVGRLQDSLERYFKYVDIEQEEFTLLDADDDYFTCYSLASHNIEELNTAYEMASAKSDKSALDNAFLNMYPSISVVVSTLNDIEEYTDMKSYLDDDYKRAQEYHTTLMEALVDYFDAGDLFIEELTAIADARQAEALEQMKAEGYEVFYAINMVIDLANDIEEELFNQDVWDENILDMDLEKIQPLYDEFVENVEAVLEYSKDESKLASEGVPIHSAYWSSFLRDMKDTKTSLTEVLQKVKDGKELSSSDLLITSIAGNCSLSSFDTGLSAMINDYNHFISY